MSNKTTKIINEKIDSFVILPRYIMEDFRNGMMTRNEYITYLYIRHQGNPYGKASISLDNIKNDMFNGELAHNSVNKIVLSLRKNGYIHYPNRSGHKGSFMVDLGDWKLPEGGIKQLIQEHDKAKEDKKNNSSKTVAEVQEDQLTPQQRLKDIKSQIAIGNGGRIETPTSRGSYNDTDNNKDNDIIDTKKTFKEDDYIPVSEFIPSNNEEARCLEVAQAVKEENINFLLSVLKEHGLNIIDRAYGLLKERMLGGESINNPAAYLNKIIQQCIDEANAHSK